MEDEERRPALIIGFDVGTTTVKGAVFDSGGAVLCKFGHEYSRTRPHEGWVEQNPDDWMDAIERALLQFRSQVDLGDVACLAICSQVNTHVFVDASGLPLIPAIVWQDTRGSGIAEELDQSFSTEEKLRIWGTEFVLDSSFALSRAAWVARELPEIWTRTEWILSPKDYCNARICGSVRADALSSVGLTDAAGEYITGLDGVLEGFSARLPELCGLFDVIGTTSLEKFPELQAKVINGTMDAWAGFFGCGMAGSGMGALITGTSSVVGLMSDEAIPTKGVITFPPFEGRFVHAGPTQAGSDALRWIAGILGQSIEDILRDCQPRRIKSRAPIFLPYLNGERAPLWDPIARGCFVGLSGADDDVDLALAVMEGVAFSERHLMEECARAAGYAPAGLRLAGGSSVSDCWSQLRSDVLGVKLERTSVSDSGTLGSALIAAVGAGLFNDVGDAIRRLVSVGKVFQPNESRREKFSQRYRLYRSTYEQLRPVFHQFSEIPDA